MKKFDINYLYIIGTIFVIAVFISLFVITIVFSPPSTFETPLYMGDSTQVYQEGPSNYIKQGEVNMPSEIRMPSMYRETGSEQEIPSMPTGMSSMPPMQEMPSMTEMPEMGSPSITMGVRSDFTLPPNIPPELLPQQYPTKVNPNLVVNSNPTTMSAPMNIGGNGPTGLTQGLIP